MRIALTLPLALVACLLLAPLSLAAPGSGGGNGPAKICAKPSGINAQELADIKALCKTYNLNVALARAAYKKALAAAAKLIADAKADEAKQCTSPGAACAKAKKATAKARRLASKAKQDAGREFRFRMKDERESFLSEYRRIKTGPDHRCAQTLASKNLTQAQKAKAKAACDEYVQTRKSLQDAFWSVVNPLVKRQNALQDDIDKYCIDKPVDSAECQAALAAYKASDEEIKALESKYQADFQAAIDKLYAALMSL